MLIDLNFGLDDQGDEACLTDIEVAITAAVEEVKGNLKSIYEVWSHSDWHCWKNAMDCKIQLLEQAGTWETVPYPVDKNVIGCKWVYQTKHKADRGIDKHKAHLVTH